LQTWVPDVRERPLAIEAKPAPGEKLALVTIIISVNSGTGEMRPVTVRDAGPVLRKYFSHRLSCYDRNIPGLRRQRASAAASSALAKGQRSTSETPASANAFTLTSVEDAAASNIGFSGVVS